MPSSFQHPVYSGTEGLGLDGRDYISLGRDYILNGWQLAESPSQFDCLLLQTRGARRTPWCAQNIFVGVAVAVTIREGIADFVSSQANLWDNLPSLPGQTFPSPILDSLMAGAFYAWKVLRSRARSKGSFIAKSLRARTSSRSCWSFYLRKWIRKQASNLSA